ncbi:Integral membrane protein, partial [human gut metagenome]
LGLTVLMIGLAIAWRGRHSGPAGAPARARLRLAGRVMEPTTAQLGLGLAVFGVVAFLVKAGRETAYFLL